MVMEQTRREIWFGICDATRHSYYYHSLNQRYQNLDTLATCILVVCGLLLLSSFWGTISQELPEWLPKGMALLIAAIAIGSRLAKFAVKAATAHTIRMECNELARKFKTLLQQVDSQEIEDEEARERLDRFLSKMDEVTAVSTEAKMKHGDRLNDRSARMAYEALRQEYAYV